MTTLDLTPDDLLTTTRTVRKRLDLDRPVGIEIIRECLEIALQAPSGSNRQGWQWVVVTDAEQRRRVGDIYREETQRYLESKYAADKLFADVVAQYAVRHRVKPGITGWAQVNGWRGETRTEEQLRQRVRYDLDYIQDWSLWLDVKILFLTLLREIRSTTAF